VAQYSIKDLEHLSGIKAHTIRIWEQRYNVLNPKRTETNIRYYDDTDLKTILNISLLNENGYKISKIAKMTDAQITAAVLELGDLNAPIPQQMGAMLLAMIEMEEERFDKLLTTLILQRGLEKTMLDVVCPFLVKTGILWQAGSITPAQEHFVSNIIRQKLMVAIDGQMLSNRDTAPRFLLFLPEGELHEIGLLFSNFLLRSRGCHVMYLGQNLPFPDLVTCVHYYKPHFICTGFTAYPERSQVQQYVNDLSQLASEIIIYVGGNQAQFDFLKFPANIIQITSLPHFINYIEKIKKLQLQF
jgi:DNA-binding transcriptional MerR regulator/methylmalonyl-CoA mutase cobalamin-binding subunit